MSNDYDASKGKKNDEDDKKSDVVTVDKKCPQDMKAFWRNVNNNFFRPSDEKNLNEINHLILYNSGYGTY